MGKIQPIQEGFHGGEVSPLMEMRTTEDNMEYAVRKMENWFCYLQGPAETRKGFERVDGIPGGYGRAFDLYINSYTGFIITVTPLVVHVSDNNGRLAEDDLVENGDFLDGPLGWTIEEIGGAQVVFAIGVCAMVSAATVNHAQISQAITVVPNNLHGLQIQIASGAGEVHIDVGTTEFGTDIYSAIHQGTATISIPDLATVGTVMYLTVRVEAGQLAKLISDISMHDTTIAPVVIEFPSPWETNADIRLIQAEAPPKESALYLVSSNVAPYRLNYDLVTREWDLELVPFIDPPIEWEERSWPGAITFFQGRAYYGGVTNDPEGFWASRPGSELVAPYVDMTLGSDPDSAIYYALSKKGIIRWMEGAETLLVGTENGEHIVTSVGGVIIPGDIQVQQQSANGSYITKAQLAGNNVLYASADGRKIRSMSFAWTKEAWLSQDITFAAEHITRAPDQLVEVYYAHTPDSIIWAVTTGGNIIGGTYDPIPQTAGFHKHKTQGRVVSICIKRFGGVDELWALVDRDGEGLELSLERYNDEAHMDAYTQFNFTTPTTELTGLEYLAGKTCRVLADGALHPDVVVREDGTVTLNIAATIVFIGLGYVCTLVTLPRDDSMNMGGFKSGSSRSAFKRWNKIWARIIQSWKPQINGKRPPERSSRSRMDLIEPPATENVQVSTLGWDEEATITIVQDLPLRTIVAGVFGELDQETIL